MQLRVLLTAETPLSFRAGRDPARSTTLQFIPGTNVLGGLADAHSALGRPKDEFARFFLQGAVQIGNCYPADFYAPTLQGDRYPVLPVPHTARTCKRFGGFRYHAAEEDDERAGVTDAAIPLALFVLSGQQSSGVLDSLRRHPQTGHPLDQLQGFYRRGARSPSFGQPQTGIGIRTRTGINALTGTVQQSILYSRETIPEGRSFWGRWVVDDSEAQAFGTFVAEAVEARLVRIGNNRTRGFGLIQFEARTWADDTVQALEQRVLAFTDLFRRAAVQAGIDTPHDATYLPITLSSDAILSDQLLRCRMRLEAADLAAAGIPDAVLLCSMAGARLVEGWNALLGLPRTDAWAMNMGSVFLFRLSHVHTGTWQALADLQTNGIGERRAEGFGMLRVADPFHIELAEGTYV